jgi:hypothetical protein
VVPGRLAARIAERRRAMGRPLRAQDRILLEVLVQAADPALADPARALLGRVPEPPMPWPRDSRVLREIWFSRWDSPGAVSSLHAPDWDDVLRLTDQDHLLEEGWISGEQAWFPVRSRGLDEAMGREDCPPDTFELLAGAYGQRLPPAWRPNRHTLRCFERWQPRSSAYQQELASEVVRGLRSASLTALEVFEAVRPARLVAELAEPDLAASAPSGVDPAVRGLADLRGLLAGRLADRLGADADGWTRLVLAVESRLDQPLVTLIDEAAVREPSAPGEPAPRWWPKPEWPGLPHSFNVLLALAPSEVAAQVLRRLPTRARRMAGWRPLFPALIDAALGPCGDEDSRAAVAASPWTPETTLRALVEDADIGENVLWDVVRSRGDAALRAAAIRRLLERGTTPGRLAEGLRDGPVGISLLFADEADPVLLADLVRHVPHFRRPEGRADRLRLYARLAALAGPEPVWALELGLSGSLEAMGDAVRASMSSGDAGPLLAGAREPFPATPTAVPETWPAPPCPAAGWSCADLVRRALDGRVDRWLLLAGLFRDPAGSSDLEDLAALIERAVAALP